MLAGLARRRLFRHLLDGIQSLARRNAEVTGDT